jgi:polysaccharide biosynthesis/export protein
MQSHFTPSARGATRALLYQTRTVFSRGIQHAALTATVLLAACSVTPQQPRNGVAPQHIALRPFALQEECLLIPGDELDVRVLNNPELNVTTLVRPDGRVALPLAGTVMAAKRTPESLQAEIQQLLANELQSPRVTVIVKSFAERRAHVGGEVGKPGLVKLQGPTSVLDAILQTGGLLESAYLEQVVVLRATQSGSLDPVRDGVAPYMPVIVDLTRVLDGTDTSQNIELEPFDIVYVSRSRIANVNVWVDQYLRKNIPIGVAVRPDLNL